MGWWKRERKAEPEADPVSERLLAERLGRIAAGAAAREQPPPPPPPVILLLEPPNYRREFISRFPWTGGMSPFEPIEEVKHRVPQGERERHWWDRR